MEIEIVRLEAEIERLRAELSRVLSISTIALSLAVKWAAHLWTLWDSDQDAKVGKGLKALAGHLPRYAPDTDGIHGFYRELLALRQAAKEEQ